MSVPEDKSKARLKGILVAVVIVALILGGVGYLGYRTTVQTSSPAVTPQAEGQFPEADQTATTAKVSAQPPPLRKVSQAELINHIHALIVSPEDPNVLYVAAHTGLVAGFNKSTFEYEWYYINEDGAAYSGFDYTALFLDPENPTIMYTFAHPIAHEETGLRRSYDRGQTWELVTSRPDPHNSAVSQTKPYTIYALDFPTFVLTRSEDKGASWKLVNSPARMFSLSVNPTNSYELIVGTDNGLYISKDGGETWSPVSDQFQGATVTAVSYGATPDIMYIGARKLGLMKTIDGGKTWTQIGNGITPGDIPRFISIDPRSPDTIYLASFGILYKSLDGGENFTIIRPQDKEITFER